MVAANPTLPRTALFVATDKNQWLTEVRVCLTLRRRPAAVRRRATSVHPMRYPVRVWPR